MTTTSPMPDKVMRFLSCNLIHTKVPTLTGNLIWDEKEKSWKREIIWVCKECNGVL